MLTLSTLIAFILYSDHASAYWRMPCSVSQESRVDPILDFGGLSTHVHKFAGGININAASTGESLEGSNCSTCEVQEDKSAYWTPKLYYQYADGTFQDVRNDGMTVYYVGLGGDVSNTRAFPPGFRMVAGNPNLRHYDNLTLTYNNVRPVADQVSFRCINEANDIPETHYIGPTNCVNGLRAQINFPSCWDGQNLYLNQSKHMAHTSGINYGECPPTHPVPLPLLFFEVLYWVNDIAQEPNGRFVLSNGDATGFGFHADFLNGWNQEVLEDAVQNCLYTDNNGVISACPALLASSDVNFSRSCPQAPHVLNEQITGRLSALPGCNPVTTDETMAAHPSCAAGSTAANAASVAITSTAISNTNAFTTSINSSTTQFTPSAFTTTNITVISSPVIMSSSISTPTSTSASISTPSPSSLLTIASTTTQTSSTTLTAGLLAQPSTLAVDLMSLTNTATIAVTTLVTVTRGSTWNSWTLRGAQRPRILTAG